MAVDSVLLAAAGGGEEAEVQGAAEVERCSVHREEVVVEGSEAEEEDEAVAAAAAVLRPFFYNARTLTSRSRMRSPNSELDIRIETPFFGGGRAMSRQGGRYQRTPNASLFVRGLNLQTR